MTTAADRVPWSVTLIVMLGGFLHSLVAGGVDPACIVSGLEPRLDGAASLLLAAGMLGATVMPHVIYLRGAFTRHRYARATEAERAALLRSQRIDDISAMGAAGVLNVIMLVVAARVLSQVQNRSPREAAHSGLTTALGPTAAVLFAVALLASSFAASGVGTLAGQVVMTRFLRRKSRWHRVVCSLWPLRSRCSPAGWTSRGP